jgi:hypothetical protein
MFIGACGSSGGTGGPDAGPGGGTPDAGPTGGGMRHLSARLKLAKDYNMRMIPGATVPAYRVFESQLPSRQAFRAQKSPASAKALAKHFAKKETHGMVPRPAQRDPLAPVGARLAQTAYFSTDVAVFAYDDSTGTYLDAQYLDPDTGYFDVGVPDDSPTSLWIGTYDTSTQVGTPVLPVDYGFNYELPPASSTVDFTYDGYFYTDPTTITADDAYAVWNADQSGYYEIQWDEPNGSSGTSYVYLTSDDPSVGSYYWVWDDGTCAGTQVYIAFDSSGDYFSINGVDAPLSMSGQSNQNGYLGGTGRWTVVGDDGYSYDASITMTYLGSPPAQTCSSSTLAVPPDPLPSECPAGCSVDSYFGICTMDGTLDTSTGVGVSCDLVDVSAPLTSCPPGCAELVPSDGFCYDNNGDPSAGICY